jgi:hypothetical protein
MATSSTTTAWAKGFSDNPAGKTLRAKSIIEILDRIGDEKVRAPGGSPGPRLEGGRDGVRRWTMAYGVTGRRNCSRSWGASDCLSPNSRRINPTR